MTGKKRTEDQQIIKWYDEQIPQTPSCLFFLGNQTGLSTDRDLITVNRKQLRLEEQEQKQERAGGKK